MGSVAAGKKMLVRIDCAEEVTFLKEGRLLFVKVALAGDGRLIEIK